MTRVTQLTQAFKITQISNFFISTTFSLTTVKLLILTFYNKFFIGLHFYYTIGSIPFKLVNKNSLNRH